MKRATSKPLELPSDRSEITRADLVFYGVDHSGPSYAAHVFIDNPKASARTRREREQGYAGSYTVFGHAGCFGSEGHCAPNDRFVDDFDLRPPHPLEPFTRVVTVTETVAAVAGPTFTVTVVPEVTEVEGVSAPSIAPFTSVRLLVYEG